MNTQKTLLFRHGNDLQLTKSIFLPTSVFHQTRKLAFNGEKAICITTFKYPFVEVL